jgi:hypothetical protein
MTRKEVIRKLREVGSMKIGTEPEDMPEWLRSASSWGIPLSELCREAADLIEERK